MLTRRIVLWLVAGVAGALQFWLVQVLTGGPTITAFMGQQIVEAGGYPAGLTTLVGWGVHLGVSLSYAFLVGLLVLALGRLPFPARTGVTLVLAALLGWVTTAIAPPAISVTIRVLGGQGWPAELFPLNWEVGLPFWNHELFFGLAWLIQAVVPRALGRWPGPGRPTS